MVRRFILPPAAICLSLQFIRRNEYPTIRVNGAEVISRYNVAQYAAEKVLDFGGIPITLSDSSGSIHDADGIDREKLDYIMELKNVHRGRIHEYAEKFGCEFMEGKRPWSVSCDIALPCATQNEVDKDNAKALVKNGCICISEGANMPTEPDAVDILHKNDVLFGPGKASNAGGVAVSGLEMSQNSMRINWTRDEVDNKLSNIMKHIHEACISHGSENGSVNYVKGANIAGFIKIADSMLDQGVV